MSHFSQLLRAVIMYAPLISLSFVQQYFSLSSPFTFGFLFVSLWLAMTLTFAFSFFDAKITRVNFLSTKNFQALSCWRTHRFVGLSLSRASFSSLSVCIIFSYSIPFLHSLPPSFPTHSLCLMHVHFRLSSFHQRDYFFTRHRNY